MEQNYPVKYAVLELTINGGWSNGYRDITKGFIVSKCYVVESRIRYLGNGEDVVEHDVVFPYSEFYYFYFPCENQEYRLPEPTIPKYDASDKPYPVRCVSKLFDTYRMAKCEAEISNIKLKRKLIEKLCPKDGETWSGVISKFEDSFEEDMRKCNDFEDLITEDLDDMQVSNDGRVKKLEPVK